MGSTKYPNPLCLQCKAPVSKLTHWVTKDKDDLPKEVYGRPVILITRKEENNWAGRHSWRVWTGQWKGGGFFHSNACAVRWARKQASVYYSKREAQVTS